MWMPTWTLLPLTFTVGSGKPLTPWLRMQAEYRYASAPGLPDAAAPVADEDGGEFPPQPAMITATAAPASRAGKPRRSGEGRVSVGVISLSLLSRWDVAAVVEKRW
jgi:hypothetical protein